MTATFTQTDTDADVNAKASHCSGATAATGGGSALCENGATAGTLENNNAHSGSPIAQAIIWFEIAADDENYDGGSGDWTIRLNVSTANHQIDWEDTYICRLNSSYVNQETLGSLTAQNINFGTTGVKTMTVNQSADATINAGDIIVVILVCDNNQGMTQSVFWTPSEDITAPGTIVAAADFVYPPDSLTNPVYRM